MLLSGAGAAAAAVAVFICRIEHFITVFEHFWPASQPASQPVPYPRFIRFLGEGGETNIGERRKNDYAQWEQAEQNFVAKNFFPPLSLSFF